MTSKVAKDLLKFRRDSKWTDTNIYRIRNHISSHMKRQLHCSNDSNYAIENHISNLFIIVQIKLRLPHCRFRIPVNIYNLSKRKFYAHIDDGNFTPWKFLFFSRLWISCDFFGIHLLSTKVHRKFNYYQIELIKSNNYSRSIWQPNIKYLISKINCLTY